MFILCHRFLVFFDDGFAQYMTEKKMHHVIHAGNNLLPSLRSFRTKPCSLLQLLQGFLKRFLEWF